MSSSSKHKISIIHRINRLKLKAGADLSDDRASFIDPLAIYRSQRVIDEGAEQYDEELEVVLVKLDSSWSDLLIAKDDKSAQRVRSQLYNYANNVKDLAETYGYSLMSHFGESLRAFSEHVDPASEPHQIIVQAHLDVMWVTFHQGLKTDDNALAQELKEVVAKAIQTYSSPRNKT